MIGILALHRDIQMACLEGKRLDNRFAATEMDKIVNLLQEPVIAPSS
ncbi:MAG: hypothetical protein ACOZF2_15970 [Thermodesulfobacteriota bacterium]